MNNIQKHLLLGLYELCCGLAVHGQTVNVPTIGNDKYAGTKGKPVATFEKLRH